MRSGSSRPGNRTSSCARLRVSSGVSAGCRAPERRLRRGQGGPNHMLAIEGRDDVAIVADDASQAGASLAGGKDADLAPAGRQRQPCGLAEHPDIDAVGEDYGIGWFRAGIGMPKAALAMQSVMPVPVRNRLRPAGRGRTISVPPSPPGETRSRRSRWGCPPVPSFRRGDRAHQVGRQEVGAQDRITLPDLPLAGAELKYAAGLAATSGTRRSSSSRP